MRGISGAHKTELKGCEGREKCLLGAGIEPFANICENAEVHATTSLLCVARLRWK